ncbi:MAG: UDP-3-O-acyl-N-acetylglucosamine deacetylase [Phycisphaerales bacterium JB052]
MQRTTLTQPVTLEGTGLFSAIHTRMTIAPSDHTGIVFDLMGTRIPACIDALSLRPVHPVFAQLKPRCTSVGTDTHTIATIEHLMSALTGLGITDATITIESDEPDTEIPILDGSAKPFVDAIVDTGLQQLDEHIEPLIVQEPITVVDADASITIEPSESPEYTYHIDYPNTPIGSARVTWSGDRDEYISHIAPARTFSLQHEAQQMQAAGLFTHLTTSDMLVIGPEGPIENAFRLPEECARHKLLDLIGDLALIGRPLLGRVTATRSGHALAHEAARALVAQR